MTCFLPLWTLLTAFQSLWSWLTCITTSFHDFQFLMFESKTSSNCLTLDPIIKKRVCTQKSLQFTRPQEQTSYLRNTQEKWVGGEIHVGVERVEMIVLVNSRQWGSRVSRKMHSVLSIRGTSEKQVQRSACCNTQKSKKWKVRVDEVPFRNNTSFLCSWLPLVPGPASLSKPHPFSKPCPILSLFLIQGQLWKLLALDLSSPEEKADPR